MYFNPRRTMSYNALFNWIVGVYGCGKTYGSKKAMIENFIATGEQFIYLRRYNTELADIDRFFDDLYVNEAFPENELQIKKSKRTTVFTVDKEIAGYAMALSTYISKKSVPFPRVTWIIFDEFIIDKSTYHYLRDEVSTFLKFYTTVSRNRDVRVLFLANAITITNPYFIYFDLHLPYKTDIICKGDKLVQLVDDPEYRQKVNETRFGKIVAGTPFAEHAIDNKFSLDNKTFIEKKTGNSTFLFSIKYNNDIFGVWVDHKTNLYYVSLDYDKLNPFMYCLTMDDHSPNTMLLKGRESSLINKFIDHYKFGCVRFETQNLKNLCNEIIKLTL